MTISGTCLKVTVIQSDSCKEKETMKMKKRMMKMAAMMMAMTMVMGSAMTVHASEDGCYHGDDGVSDGWGGDMGFDSGSSSSSSASYSAPAKRAPGSNTGVTGKEQFRALAKSGEGSYKVTHKGQTIATFWLVDAEGKNVPCNAVALKQRSDDKKWAINFEVADSEGLNIGAPIDRTYMFKTLGVSYVTINDTVIIDIEAEASVTK